MPSQTYAATINATGTTFVFVPSLPTDGVEPADKFTFVLGAGWGSHTSAQMTILFTSDGKTKTPFSSGGNPITVTTTPNQPAYNVNNSVKGAYTLEVPAPGPKLTTLTGTLKVNNN